MCGQYLFMPISLYVHVFGYAGELGLFPLNAVCIALVLTTSMVPPLTTGIPLKVERIKERVEEKEGIPPQQQRLIYSGKQM